MQKFSAIFILILYFLNVTLTLSAVSIDFKSSQNQIQSQLVQLLSSAQDQDHPLSIEEFQDSILKIINQVQESQVRHQQISKKMYNQCQDEESFRTKEIKFAKLSYKAADEAYERCHSSLTSAIKNLPKLKRSISDYAALLLQKTNQRRRSHEQYLSLDSDWSEAIMFLIEFNIEVKKTSEELNNANFSQLTESLIKHMTKVGKLSSLSAIFMELTSEGNAGTLTRLTGLVTDLKNLLISDQKEARVEEKKQIASFESLKVTLQNIIDQLTKNVKLTTKQIVSMGLCVTNERKIMVSAAAKEFRNERLKKLANVTCVDFAKNFVSATKNRLAEINSLKQIIKIVQRRFGQLDSKIMKGLNNVSNGLKVYVNRTEFKKYQEYIKVKVEDNEHGAKLVNSN